MSMDDDWLDKDYRAFFDYTYLRPWELPAGKDVDVTIERVERVEIGRDEKKRDHKICLYFHGKTKGLVCGKEMGKALKAMYGKKARAWIGKRITIYVTKERAFGETHDVIRIRPEVPRGPRGKPRPELPAAPGVVDAEFEEAAEAEKEAS